MRRSHTHTHIYTHTHTHTHTQKGQGAITPHTLSYHSLWTFFGQTQGSSSPGKTSFAVQRGRQAGGREGVHGEKSAGNYGRRQFRSNQREIWGGLGWGLIGAGTRCCIHLSMRGLHQQSSPGWPNQSLLLTPSPPSFSIHSAIPPSLSLISRLPSCPAPQHFTLRSSQMVLSRAT